MTDKLFDSEAKIMEIIWSKSPISAKEISLISAETIGWNKNTTYTVIKNWKPRASSDAKIPDLSALLLYPGIRCRKPKRNHF